MKITEATKQKKYREIFLIALVAVLMLVNGVKWFYDSHNEQVLRQEVEDKEMELVRYYAQLDSLSEQVSARIKTIEGLNGQAETLVAAQKQLEAEKKELRLAAEVSDTRYRVLSVCYFRKMLKLQP